jgi:hypothetical protein
MLYDKEDGTVNKLTDGEAISLLKNNYTNPDRLFSMLIKGVIELVELDYTYITYEG